MVVNDINTDCAFLVTVWYKLSTDDVGSFPVTEVAHVAFGHRPQKIETITLILSHFHTFLPSTTNIIVCVESL